MNKNWRRSLPDLEPGFESRTLGFIPSDFLFQVEGGLGKSARKVYNQARTRDAQEPTLEPGTETTARRRPPGYAARLCTLFPFPGGRGPVDDEG